MAIPTGPRPVAMLRAARSNAVRPAEGETGELRRLRTLDGEVARGDSGTSDDLLRIAGGVDPPGHLGGRHLRPRKHRTRSRNPDGDPRRAALVALSYH
jgi:hypothetical protein